MGSEHGMITPEVMCLAISLLAASWNCKGMGLGEDTQYGMLLGLRKIFMSLAHIGLLSKLSENTVWKADNILLRKEEKQLAAAATAGKEAGMTHKVVGPAIQSEHNDLARERPTLS